MANRDLKLLDLVGEGGMSTVWRAFDRRRNGYVAVKILNRELTENLEDVQAFEEEKRLMTRLRHPGIVAAYDFDTVDNSLAIIMEYVDGYSFSDLLRRKFSVPETDCLLICESVAAALDYAWNECGIVHCDIKPENILINSEGVVKLTDLGISHEYAFLDGPQEVPEHVTGTPAYISPEQVYGDVELDCRTDIYSLGATLYHLATGRTLFPCEDCEDTMRSHCEEDTQALDPRSYKPSLSEGFCQMLESMLVKDRSGRLQTWQDVYAICKDVEAGIAFKPRTTNGNASFRLIGQ